MRTFRRKAIVWLLVAIFGSSFGPKSALADSSGETGAHGGPKDEQVQDSSKDRNQGETPSKEKREEKLKKELDDLVTAISDGKEIPKGLSDELKLVGELLKSEGASETAGQEKEKHGEKWKAVSERAKELLEKVRKEIDRVPKEERSEKQEKTLARAEKALHALDGADAPREKNDGDKGTKSLWDKLSGFAKNLTAPPPEKTGLGKAVNGLVDALVPGAQPEAVENAIHNIVNRLTGPKPQSETKPAEPPKPPAAKAEAKDPSVPSRSAQASPKPRITPEEEAIREEEALAARQAASARSAAARPVAPPEARPETTPTEAPKEAAPSATSTGNAGGTSEPATAKAASPPPPPSNAKTQPAPKVSNGPAPTVATSPEPAQADAFSYKGGTPPPPQPKQTAGQTPDETTPDERHGNGTGGPGGGGGGEGVGEGSGNGSGGGLSVSQLTQAGGEHEGGATGNPNGGGTSSPGGTALSSFSSAVSGGASRAVKSLGSLWSSAVGLGQPSSSSNGSQATPPGFTPDPRTAIPRVRQIDGDGNVTQVASSPRPSSLDVGPARPIGRATELPPEVPETSGPLVASAPAAQQELGAIASEVAASSAPSVSAPQVTQASSSAALPDVFTPPTQVASLGTTSSRPAPLAPSSGGSMGKVAAPAGRMDEDFFDDNEPSAPARLAMATPETNAPAKSAAAAIVPRLEDNAVSLADWAVGNSPSSPSASSPFLKFEAQLQRRSDSEDRKPATASANGPGGQGTPSPSQGLDPALLKHLETLLTGSGGPLATPHPAEDPAQNI